MPVLLRQHYCVFRYHVQILEEVKKGAINTERCHQMVHCCKSLLFLGQHLLNELLLPLTLLIATGQIMLPTPSHRLEDQFRR